MYKSVTLRIWESYFETFLRFKLPHNNILTLREIGDLTGERALDSFKKTNGQVTIISEAAEDRMKAYVVKGALEASDAVIWTGHAETPDALVQSLRNACINVGAFKDESMAEDQVLSILGLDFHLNKNSNGDRFCGRITYFRRLDETEYTSDTDERAFHSNAKKFFEMKTGAKRYEPINLIEYDEANKRYLVKNPISQKMKDSIYKSLQEHDKEEFLEFIQRFEKQINEVM